MAAPRNPRTKVEPAAPVKGKWATMLDEATADYEPRPDYLFDGTTPPTPIKEPVTAEQITALAMLIDQEGNVDPENIRPLFEAVCGDSFPRIWAVVGRAHANALLPLFMDINNHFNAVPGAEGADLPGGE